MREYIHEFNRILDKFASFGSYTMQRVTNDDDATGYMDKGVTRIVEATFEPAKTPAIDRLPFYSLVTANVISQLGNSITNLAVIWYVIETTGSAANAGFAGFFTLLPMVIATFFGGALVDRFGRKWMSIVSDWASAVTIIMIPLLHETVGLPLWALFGLIFCGALLDAPGATARRAMVPELAERAGMPLERATSAMQSVAATVELLGPIIAGVLVATVGTTNVLFFDSATFLISALIVARVIPAMPPLVEAGGRYLDEVKEGIRFLFSRRVLVTILTAALVANFFAAPLGGVLLPVFADEQAWGARSLGFMFSGFGAGMIAGTILFGALSEKLQRRTWMIASILVLGVMIGLLSVASILPMAVGLIVLAGIPLGIINPVVSTVFLEKVPGELRGRVLGATGAMSMSAAPLGMLLAGPTVEVIGVDAGFILVGSVFVLISIWLFIQPSMREIEKEIAPVEASA